MTANWEAIDVEEDDIAETISRRDFEEGVAAMRGVIVGLALTFAGIAAFIVSGVLVWVVVGR